MQAALEADVELEAFVGVADDAAERVVDELLDDAADAVEDDDGRAERVERHVEPLLRLL